AQGMDILYIHFSKQMSGTFNAMHLAIDELKELYPNQTIYTIDTKAITIGSYPLLREISRLYKENKTIDEIMEWALVERDHFATYFYADDLKFFSKSGRVSNLAAIMGTIFGIHPIITMDDNGVMKAVTKARGRMGSLKKIVDYVVELADDIENHPIVIGHTDALDIAMKLGEMLKSHLNKELDIEYVLVNPTAGAHCGPDTVGVSFHAKHR
ncbi:MAG: DegV family protein, partial [Anaeroplasmataceae bacterium]|nr:DegV family protein [Anaeroplasmataceae bacterium]